MRNSVLKRGFLLLRQDNIRMREKIRSVVAENRRLSNIMFCFEF